MLISPAYAQTAGGAMGELTQFLPLILIFAVFYFLLIRPQQLKQKEIKAALSALKRGDRVVTGGGVLGVVSKPPKSAEEREIEVEIAPNVRIVVLRETIAAVITPVAANDARPPKPARPAAPAGETPKLGDLFKGLFGKKDGDKKQG
jgi:preprotein translocase subunit YajC